MVPFNANDPEWVPKSVSNVERVWARVDAAGDELGGPDDYHVEHFETPLWEPVPFTVKRRWASHAVAGATGGAVVLAVELLRALVT